MDAEINNVIYMELYLGPKMMDDEYFKSNIARSIDRDSTVPFWKVRDFKLQLHTSVRF
jgi:hypothetical protein